MIAVHFGAGNIGRGFIGSLLHDAGYETVFVDVNEAVINEINEKGRYTIELAGQEDTLQVANISGLNSLTQAEAVVDVITRADVITTAVGPHILSAIAPLLAQGLERRLEQATKPVNVIACENMIGGSETLRDEVVKQLSNTTAETLDEWVGFPNAAVDRIVPEQNNEELLTVKVEPFYEWVVETTAIKGERPDINGVTYVEDLTPYIERKLFTVNTGHATAAYLGHLYERETIKEAMDDPAIHDKVFKTLKETGAVLIKKYNFDESTHTQYIEKIIGRFLNPDLSDDVRRVARAPKRKLGAKDRLVRPALEYIYELGKKPEQLAEVIAAALIYQNEDDPEAVALQELIQEKGVMPAFQEVSGVDSQELLQLVETYYHELKG